MRKPALAFKLLQVLVHICVGMATCALVFPFASPARRDACVQRWSRRLLGICRVRVEVEPGSPALAPALVVANHVSWLDIVVINAVLPCRFVAKAEVRRWPLIGSLSQGAGTLFVERGSRRQVRRIIQDMALSLRRGERVAFFPEGTTALQGTVLPFHANLFEAALDAAVPVQPLALCYHDRHGQLHGAVAYVGDTSFIASLVAILGAGPIRARLDCLPALEPAGLDRRALAAAAQRAVSARLGQRQASVDVDVLAADRHRAHG